MSGSILKQSDGGKAIAYITASAVTIAVPALTLPILTRWLTPADYGIVALGQIVALLFMGLVNLGVSTGLERNFFKYEVDARLGSLIHSGLALIAGGTILWGALFWGLRRQVSWALTGAADWGLLIWVMCLTSALGLLVTVQLIYLRNDGKATEYATFAAGGAVLESILAVVLVVFARVGVWGLVAGQVVGKSVVVAALWFRLARSLPPRFDAALARELLGIGLPLTPKVIVSVADKGVDRLLVNWLNSLGQVGLFGLASGIGYSIFSLLTSLEHVYIPQVYRLMFQGGEDGRRAIGKYLTPYVYCSLFVPVAVVLFIEEISRVLVGPAFSEIKYLVPLLAAYYGQTFFGKISGAQFTYRKKLWYATPFGALSLLLHLGFGLLLVPRYGAFGAAIAVFATGLVVDAISFWIAQREYRIAYEARFVLPMLALLYASVAWVLLPRFAPLPYGIVASGKLLLFACLLAAGLRRLPAAWMRLAELTRARRGRAAATNLPSL